MNEGNNQPPLSEDDLDMRARIFENSALEYLTLFKLRFDQAQTATKEHDDEHMMTLDEVQAWHRKAQEFLDFQDGAESVRPAEKFSTLWFELQTSLRNAVQICQRIEDDNDPSEAWKKA
jgi:hypothetical protein